MLRGAKTARDVFKLSMARNQLGQRCFFYMCSRLITKSMDASVVVVFRNRDNVDVVCDGTCIKKNISVVGETEISTSL